MSVPSSRALRIVIGENSPDLATTMTLLLESEPDMAVVAQASSLSEVLRAASEQLPNAFILDLTLDDGSSAPLIKTLREQLPAAVIIVFTGHDSDMIRRHCLEAGADEVVIKSSPIEVLIAALRAERSIPGSTLGSRFADQVEIVERKALESAPLVDGAPRKGWNFP